MKFLLFFSLKISSRISSTTSLKISWHLILFYILLISKNEYIMH